MIASINLQKVFRYISISTQLLIAVNTILGIALVLLLWQRYTQEMEGEVRKKHLSLQDEAFAIHSAIEHLNQSHNLADIQDYINAICHCTSESTALCHRVAIKREGVFLQAATHSDESPDYLSLVTAASLSEKHLDSASPTLVAASYSANGLTVYVAENLSGIRSVIWQETRQQLWILGGLSLLAALIVNLVLLKIVRGPLGILLQIVDRISEGDFQIRVPSFSTSEMERLSQAINTMTQKLEMNERERNAQLSKAQAIQQHLLPGLISIPGIHQAHRFQPADVVAGDYCDFLPLKTENWLICLADVTGHGIPAAMGATMLKSLLLSATEHPTDDPAELLAYINYRFSQLVLPGNFASMFLAVWNPVQWEFTWASAGHDPGIIVRADGTREDLESTGTLLGIDAQITWQSRQTQMNQYDRILLFSDGVPETANLHGELFTRQRVAESFCNCSHLTVAATLETIAHQLDTYRDCKPAHDDITMIALEIK